MGQRLLVSLLLTLGLAGFILARAPAARAQLDGLTITMDADQYNVGDSGGFCYTVPGPGQVTVTNNGVNGTATLLSGQDDGTGDCDMGTIQGPAGKYCVIILFSGAAGAGTAQSCYQVNDPGTEN
jgi:hypothetical protein